jgi:hypothetical protein
MINDIPKETLSDIFYYIDAGSDYKSCLWVCHHWYDVIYYPDKKWEYVNQLWELIRLYPKKPWDRRSISRNPNTTLRIIIDHPNFPWGYDDLSYNPNITIDIIKSNLDKDWNWFVLSKHKNITYEDVFLDEVTKRFPWKEFGLMQNPNIPVDHLISIISNVNHRISLSKHPALTMDHVLEYKKASWHWDWNSLSKHPNIKFHHIRDNPTLPWVFHLVSKHAPMEYIEMNNRLPWDYEEISYNPNLTIGFVLGHLDKYWDWSRVSSNCGISLQDIIDNPELPWEYDFISCNDNLTLEFVVSHMDENWSWYQVAQNKNIKISDIVKLVEMTDLRPYISLEYRYMVMNPNLTAKFVIDHIDGGWDFGCLSENSFGK